jgi:hypothetical protein
MHRRVILRVIADNGVPVRSSPPAGITAGEDGDCTLRRVVDCSEVRHNGGLSGRNAACPDAGPGLTPMC